MSSIPHVPNIIPCTYIGFEKLCNCANIAGKFAFESTKTESQFQNSFTILIIHLLGHTAELILNFMEKSRNHSRFGYKLSNIFSISSLQNYLISDLILESLLPPEIHMVLKAYAHTHLPLYQL